MVEGRPMDCDLFSPTINYGKSEVLVFIRMHISESQLRCTKRMHKKVKWRQNVPTHCIMYFCDHYQCGINHLKSILLGLRCVQKYFFMNVFIFFKLAYGSWICAFVLQNKRDRHVELGLGGTGTQMVVWVFGQEWRLDLELKLLQWYSVCLTWSGGSNRLRVFLNGTMRSQASFANVTAHQHLGQNGTLTLGMSHYMDPSGAIKVEKGNNLIGAIGQFKMWSSEWSEEELGRRTCADGDVVSWDLRQWKHDCPIEKDARMHCGKKNNTVFM